MEIMPQYERGEGPDEIDRALEEERPSFRESIPSNENSASRQIRAYTAHVQEVMARTGKNIQQVVAEEKEALKRAGTIDKFLANL